MISLSNIIKSAAVVDDRPQSIRFAAGGREGLRDRTVIKRQVLGGLPPEEAVWKLPPTKDSLLEELNRIRIKIADAEKELRSVEQERELVAREVDTLLEQREALKQMEGMSLDDQAKSILRDAEEQARKTVEGAKSRAAEAVEQLKAQGYLDGLEQGASEAHERFRTEHEPEIRHLEQLLESLSGMRDDMVKECENEIVSLIIAVAERVINRALEDDPKVVVGMLRAVLEQHRREEFIKVVLSPDLLSAGAKVSENIRKTLQQMGENVEISIDPGSAPGTAVVETPGGFTDLSVQTQLGNLHDMLLEEM